MTSRTPPPRPKPELVAKDPACLWPWMDDYWDYCLLEGLEEAREERRRQLRAKLVRLIQARSWHLAEYDRRRPRLVYDRDSGIIE